MDQLLERLNKASNAAKFGGLAAVVILLTAGFFFGLVQPVEDELESVRNQQDAADRTLAEKKEIADNLKDRQRELGQLDLQLQDALTELPESKDIDDLLAQLNDVGKKAGLEIARVTPGNEVPEAFFARIPVSMTVSGNYNEIAMFLQEIANMRRIVNVNNIKLSSPTMRGDKVILTSTFLATTFRFLSKPAPHGKPGTK